MDCAVVTQAVGKQDLSWKKTQNSCRVQFPLMSIQTFLAQELLAYPHFDRVYYYYYFLSDNINDFLNTWLFCLRSYLSIQGERPSWKSCFETIKVSEVEHTGRS